MMLLAVTCICIPSVSGDKASNDSASPLIQETGVFLALEMLVQIQGLFFRTISSV